MWSSVRTRCRCPGMHRAKRRHSRRRLAPCRSSSSLRRRARVSQTSQPPLACSTTAAREAACSFTSSAFSPSTMTRTTGSVPLGRMTTRPRPFSWASMPRLPTPDAGAVTGGQAYRRGKLIQRCSRHLDRYHARACRPNRPNPSSIALRTRSGAPGSSHSRESTFRARI